MKWIVRGFDQTEMWEQKDGSLVRLDRMSPSHRANVLAFMQRAPDYFAQMLERAEREVLWPRPILVAFRIENGKPVYGEIEVYQTPDQIIAQFQVLWDRRRADPQAWIRSTPLFQRLAELVHGDAQRQVEVARELLASNPDPPAPTRSFFTP